MARYDVTGIGINLREVPDDHGAVKLKVLGIILDGPAHSAGVRQTQQENSSQYGVGISQLIEPALKHLQESGASYLVLDLRDNPGGLVQAGVEVAQLFLNKGDTVIYAVGRDPQVQKSIVAENAPSVTTPIIILVNNRTASASEIVVSALHENCKAVLVGERTYGKGLIQSVFELRDGSGIVVTIGKYVTPNHMDINGNGIVPDFPRLPAFNELMDYLSRCRAGRKG